jgi:hypothetical protein
MSNYVDQCDEDGYGNHDESDDDDIDDDIDSDDDVDI